MKKFNDKNINIIIACDHGGFKYKEKIKKHLVNSNYEVLDVGTFSENSCNYPEIVEKAIKAFLNCKVEKKFIILICKTGEGISIAANRYKNIRCGLGYNDEVVSLMRKHNDANAIAFGQNFMSLNDCLNRIKIFLNTDFEGGRHLTRVKMLEKYGS